MSINAVLVQASSDTGVRPSCATAEQMRRPKLRRVATRTIAFKFCTQHQAWFPTCWFVRLCSRWPAQHLP